MHLHTQDVPAPAPATQPPLVEEEEDREDGPVPAAATNDLLLYKSLLKFKKINKAVSTKTSTSLNRHTWYLTEDLISLSLFNDDYKTCKTALWSLSAINDSAERAIALATRFNTTITRDEASHQELLQVVEFHSRTYKCNTKDNLKKFM